MEGLLTELWDSWCRLMTKVPSNLREFYCMLSWRAVPGSGLRGLLHELLDVPFHLGFLCGLQLLCFAMTLGLPPAMVLYSCVFLACTPFLVAVFLFTPLGLVIIPLLGVVGLYAAAIMIPLMAVVVPLAIFSSGLLLLLLPTILALMYLLRATQFLLEEYGLWPRLQAVLNHLLTSDNSQISYEQLAWQSPLIWHLATNSDARKLGFLKTCLLSYSRCSVGTGDTQISTVDKDMARLVFSVIDKNKDGNLTVAEIDSFLKQKPLAKALLLPFAKKGETLAELHRAAKKGGSLAEFHGMSIEVSNWSVWWVNRIVFCFQLMGG